MSENLVNALDGNTFVVSDRRGDIEASPTDTTGLFSFDTRFLSKWVLTLDGQRLNPLSVNDLQYFETRFFLVPGTGTIYVNATLSVLRQRAVGNGFHEELTILNHDEKPVDLSVRIDAGSDFADIFEIKDAVGKKGKYYRRIDKQKLVLGYERETFRRETTISSSAPAQLDEDGLSFSLKIGPHSSWTTDLAVVTALAGRAEEHDKPKYGRAARMARPNMAHSLEKWLDDAPSLVSDWEPLHTTYRRSLVDLAALRFTLPIGRGASLPAAGLPVVYGHLRPRQHPDKPASPAVRARAGRYDHSSVGRLARHPRGRFSRRGSGPDCARDSCRGDSRVRGAAPLSLLRQRRRDPALRCAPR